jgi:hypothetical protein
MIRMRLTLLGALASMAALAPVVAAPAPVAVAKKHHARKHHKRHKVGPCGHVAHAHFVGLGGGDSLLASGAARDCVLSAQAQAGTGVLRQMFAWTSSGPPTPPIVQGGHYNFAVYDSWVRAVARHHMRILAILSNSPHTGAPRDYAGFKRFATAVVRRYGPHGSLWRGRYRHLRRYAIRSWQIWNEPNLPMYWGDHVSAKQYVKLLKAGYQGIKKADRGADVVTAGMPESLIKGAIQATKYIPQLYRAGAKRWFNTLAVNPYGPTAGNVITNVKQVRRIMNRHHDRAGGMWVAEVGWGTGGPKSRFNIGDKGQARQLGKLLKRLYHARRGLHLHGVVYYGWKDKPPYNGTDQWGLHTGLLTLSGGHKPAFKVFARLAPHLH